MAPPTLSLSALLLASLSLSGSSLAQLVAPTTGGSPAALTGSPRSRPTQSWQQWAPKPSYALSALPDQYMGPDPLGTPQLEDGQTGFNTCARGEGMWNQQSKCQTAWVNSVDDFCVWGPPEPGTVGATERMAVAYCTKASHGTRLIPDGTLTSVHFVQTSEYVQVTGTGDFTSIGIPFGDDGGEMDSAGMDDLSNPIGGVVYTTAKPSANGQPVMATEWTNFMSWNQYCFRVCFGNNAEQHCQHRYDVLGCKWNIPASYDVDVFESCDGALAPFQGVYTVNGQASTFEQGQPTTPDPHPAPSSSNCRPAPSVGNGGLLVATPLSAISASSAAAATGAATAVPAQTGAEAAASRAPPAAATRAGTSGAQQTGSGASASNGALGASGLTPAAIALAAAAAAGALLA